MTSNSDAAILDVGCGEGELLVYLKDKGFTNIHGCDQSPQCIKACRQNGLDGVHLHDAKDIENLPGPAGFDLIFAIDIIEHLSLDGAIRALSGMRNRLKVGGRLIVQVPNTGSLHGMIVYYGDLTHVLPLNENTVLSLLRAAGFDGDKIEVAPAWDAVSLIGRAREAAIQTIHSLLTLPLGRARPRVASPCLLVSAERSSD